MFGHQDDNHNDDNGEQTQVGLAPDTDNDQAAQGAPDDQGAPADSGNDGDAWQHPEESADDNQKDNSSSDEADANSPEPIRDVIQPSGTHNSDPSPQTPAHDDSGDDGGDTNAGLPHDLIDIKQQALTKLAPLVDQLDQSPEEKFRTTMMMIQASDDQGLIKAAYEAANSIEDEKVRAQALLDVVNEINYFTQHTASYHG